MIFPAKLICIFLSVTNGCLKIGESRPGLELVISLAFCVGRS